MKWKIIGLMCLFANVAYVFHWIETGEPIYAAFNAVGAFFAIKIMDD